MDTLKVINLARRKEKWERMVERHSGKSDYSLERVDAVDARNGESAVINRAVLDSHVKCIEGESGTVWVAEDDLVFKVGGKEREILEGAVDTLGEDWDILLGCASVLGTTGDIVEGDGFKIRRVKYFSGTMCMVYNMRRKSVLDYLLSIGIADLRPVDRYLSDACETLEIFVAHPFVATCENGFSDTRGKVCKDERYFESAEKDFY